MLKGTEQTKGLYKLRNEKTGVDGLWYKSFPYVFRANIDTYFTYFYLPISPQNINITTHFATNVVATLYGTVEEHSEVRYYDIVIQGTTGFVPTFTKEASTLADISITKSSTRSSYGTKEIIPEGGFGFFKKTVNLINTIKNQAQDVLKPKNQEAGVFTDNNGYIAFHNFYRFLIKHKQFASSKGGRPDSGGQLLTFLNYKDNNQYSCVIQRFVLERNAENPMLYNYSIQMRCYDLRTIDTPDVYRTNLSDRYSELGLTESKKSIAANVMKKVSSAKNALNAARSLIGNIGK